MIILGIIPARYSSTRFPGKPLADIAGKPMIQRVYERSAKSRFINKLIVATDDNRIIDCVKKFGGNAILTSKHHKTGTDRICEVISKIESDIVVNIQGDEPLIYAGNIDSAIKPLLEDKRINAGTLAIRITSGDDINDTNKVKVVVDTDSYAIYFSRSVIPNNRSKRTSIKYYKHIGLYVYRTKFLSIYKRLRPGFCEIAESLEQLRILENGYKIKVVITKKDSLSVDTPEDLTKLLSLIKNKSIKI
ncbi:MAG: 3-deoxy-manno-octulosonate cytidylyltransferase [Ignavibacteriae bacterium]|nr:3-deoxy-manno-octulosonate cytidylyltransferase [Ignavibacteriota bacterium]